jgi:hypothetical protein
MAIEQPNRAEIYHRRVATADLPKAVAGPGQFYASCRTTIRKAFYPYHSLYHER